MAGRIWTATPSHVDLNWSHSGDWLIAACVEGGRVGIDIELLRPRPKALALAQRFFAPAETAWLTTLAGDPARLQHAFTRLWCAKEAVLKAHGRGLSFGLEKLRFVLDDSDAAPRLAACDAALGAPAIGASMRGRRCRGIWRRWRGAKQPARSNRHNSRT